MSCSHPDVFALCASEEDNRDARYSLYGMPPRKEESPRWMTLTAPVSASATVSRSRLCFARRLGVIYTLRRTKDGLEGPINKRVYATFESYRAVFKWAGQPAKLRGHYRFFVSGLSSAFRRPSELSSFSSALRTFSTGGSFGPPGAGM